MKPRLLAVAGLLTMAIMNGAITFHLFTPLGIVVQGDGGTLFIMACLVWLSGLALFLMYYPSLRPAAT